MPNPSALDPRAVSLPRPELHTAVVLDNATAEKQKVRCTVESLDPLLASDPMPWMPYRGAAGLYYPKKDDAALIATPTDGPPWIVAWTPRATEPDVP